MTRIPFVRARLIAGTMAFASLGVIMMTFAPAAIMFSIAATWPALSPSLFPAPDSSLAPLALASAVAPSFIFTKKGLVSVLVIRPITGSAAWAGNWAASAAEATAAARVSLNIGLSPGVAGEPPAGLEKLEPIAGVLRRGAM